MLPESHSNRMLRNARKILRLYGHRRRSASGCAGSNRCTSSTDERIVRRIHPHDHAAALPRYASHDMPIDNESALSGPSASGAPCRDQEPPSCLLHVWRDSTRRVKNTRLIGDYGPAKVMHDGHVRLGQTTICSTQIVVQARAIPMTQVLGLMPSMHQETVELLHSNEPGAYPPIVESQETHLNGVDCDAHTMRR